MLYAFLSDIHGNLHALDAVLAEIRNHPVDRIICLGDIVGYGAFPNECVERIADMADATVIGNHDHAAVDLSEISAFNQYAHKAALWTHRQLTDANLQFLESLGYTHEENELLFVHASPQQPEFWHYIFSRSDAENAMAASPYDIAFVGHTHVPFDLRTLNGRVINVGSTGQPRDGDARAALTLFDDSTGKRTLLRVYYDVDAAADAILAAGLPPFLADRLHMGR